MSATAADDRIARRVRGSLRRYRVIAYIVGVFLLALCVGMILKYGAGDPTLLAIVGPVHGFGYMVYLALAFDLSRVAGWSLTRTLLVLLAGTVPIMSFVAERIVTTQVEAELTVLEADAARGAERP